MKAALILLLACLVGACPDLPDGIRDTDTSEGPGPLALHRLYKTTGEPTGGERVALYGDGFLPGARVTFGGKVADSVLVLDHGQINVLAPAHAAGLVDVTVVLPDGQRVTLADAYLYHGPLALSAVSPTRGSVDGGVEVTVQGAGFDDRTRVLIGGRLLEEARRLDETTIRGKVPARLLADAGPVSVIASNGYEQRTLEGAFTYEVAPALTGLAPTSGDAAGGTLVTLRGRGLDLHQEVRFGGVLAESVAAPAPERPGEAVVVRVPPGVHGLVEVTLSAPGGPVIATLPGAFFYVDTAELPTTLWAGHAQPASADRSGGARIQLSTRGLSSAAGVRVHFGALEAAPEHVDPDSGTVIVVVPPLPAGEVGLAVSQGNSRSNPVPFTALEPLALTRVEPSSGPLTGGDITLLGSGLSADAVVKVGGKVAEPRSSGSDRLVVSVPPASPGTVDLVLIQDGRELRLPAAYEYRSSETKLWAVSPELGAQSGGRIVRLFGEGFARTTPSARVGGRVAEDLTLIDDHLAIARLPPGAPGRANVDSAAGFLAMPVEYYDPGHRYTGVSGGPIPEALNVTVIDAATREGIPDAFVLLWDDLEGPYQGVTDARGQITFSDVYFGPMQMVTAAKERYTTTSIVEFDARDATLSLIPLTPPVNPGGGGGGNQPTPLPDGRLRGTVTGLDKYVVTPPGECEARISPETGALCAPCNSDLECGPGGHCALLGDQGPRCTWPCANSSECPAHYVCAQLGEGTHCIPGPGLRTARCQVTMPDALAQRRAQLVGLDSRRDYEISARPGEYAVVCLGGVEDTVSGSFTPMSMGVRRHVFAMPGELVDGQDVALDIPLTRRLRVRLDGAPTGHPETARHLAQVFIDLGAEGVFLMPQEGLGLDTNVFTLRGFPAAFEESLYDASLTVYGEAVADVPASEQSGIGSFVVHDQIRDLFSDAVFEITAEGASHRRVGIREELHAMAVAPGGERAWAVGEGGRVIAWDGTFWALQQTPVQSTLRGVWAAPAPTHEVWAVGEFGAVLRWDGLRWMPVPMPDEVAKAAWWGVEGFVDGEGWGVWLWGERGLYRRGADGTLRAMTGFAAGSVTDVAVVDGTTWAVGMAGLIRRWDGSGWTNFDKPGPDLRQVAGARADLVWAVGDTGRISRWDGRVWFDQLPMTTRDLHAVAVNAADRAWAVGDAGEVLRWDGLRWRVSRSETPGAPEETGLVQHADLRGVVETASGRVFAAGLATLVIGPFMQLPRLTNPTPEGQLTSHTLRWELDPGAKASFHWVRLAHSSGFPYWQIVAHGGRTDIPLPDLATAQGLDAIWPSSLAHVVRAYAPGFDMGAWDETRLNAYRWRSWAVSWGRFLNAVPGH